MARPVARHAVRPRGRQSPLDLRLSVALLGADAQDLLLEQPNVLNAARQLLKVWIPRGDGGRAHVIHAALQVNLPGVARRLLRYFLRR